MQTAKDAERTVEPEAAGPKAGDGQPMKANENRAAQKARQRQQARFHRSLNRTFDYLDTTEADPKLCDHCHTELLHVRQGERQAFLCTRCGGMQEVKSDEG